MHLIRRQKNKCDDAEERKKNSDKQKMEWNGVLHLSSRFSFRPIAAVRISTKKMAGEKKEWKKFKRRLSTRCQLNLIKT